MNPRMITPRRFHLRVPAEERHLAEIRDFVQEVGEKILIPNKVLGNTKLAVDEACTNIVKHGYKGRPPGYIEIVVTGNGREFSIAIHDQGQGFDLRNVKSPDLKMYVETRRRGGLGVFLMNQLMDEVRYRSGSDGNVLSMSKRLTRNRGRKGKGPRRRSLRFAYTIQAFGTLTFLVAAAFAVIHVRQMQSVRADEVARARSVARGMLAPAVEVLSHPEPMSMAQTLLNQSIRAAMKANPDLSSARVMDTTGRVWGSSSFDELFTRRAPPISSPAPMGARGSSARPARRAGSVGTIVEPVQLATFSKKSPPITLGWVEVGVSEEAVAARIRPVRTELATIALLALVLGYALSTILIGIFVRPIQVLSDNVRAIGEGTMVAEVGGSGNEDIDDIARAFNEITAKFRAAQGNLVEQERLQKEMQVAQEIQQSLLPRNVPDLEGYEIGALYRAAKEVGGDYYDFVQVDDRTIGVVVADVSGKGVPGSLVMTMIRTALRMEARGNRSASDVMARMNSFVTEDMKKGMFVTMFYVVLDSVNRIVTYASAGHNPMILYRSESDATYFLKPKGIPVGISTMDENLFRNTISVEKLTLRQDDMIVIYTDGITEAMNPSREQFGESRLLSAIKRYGHLSAQEFATALDKEIHEFTAGALQNDDITLVVIKEKVKPEERIEAKRRELFRLVEQEGVPIGEACERLQVATSTYYRYRKRVTEIGGEEGSRASARAPAWVRPASRKKPLFWKSL